MQSLKIVCPSLYLKGTGKSSEAKTNKKHSIYPPAFYQSVVSVPSMEGRSGMVIWTNVIWKIQVIYRITRSERKIIHSVILSTDICDSVFPCHLSTKGVNFWILLCLLLPKRLCLIPSFRMMNSCQKSTREKFASHPSYFYLG